jgi:hypothetical protein
LHSARTHTESRIEITALCKNNNRNNEAAAAAILSIRLKRHTARGTVREREIYRFQHFCARCPANCESRPILPADNEGAITLGKKCRLPVNDEREETCNQLRSGFFCHSSALESEVLCAASIHSHTDRLIGSLPGIMIFSLFFLPAAPPTDVQKPVGKEKSQLPINFAPNLIFLYSVVEDLNNSCGKNT